MSRSGQMATCRDCQHTVSRDAMACPNCGAPYPARQNWDGWGFEYKSQATVAGLPLLHISFTFGPNRVPVPARGVIAIGQFAAGIVTVSQFGLGIVSISQFTIAGFALAQFGFAYSLLAQFGIYVEEGRGQFVRSLSEVLGLLG